MSRTRSNKENSPHPLAPEALLDDLCGDRQDVKPGRPRRRRKLERLSISDDWPEQVPVIEEEIRVFENWFGDVFDELFSPVRPDKGSVNVSSSKKKKT